MKKFRTYLIALVAAVVLSASGIVNSTTNFSGRWVIDLNKSDFGTAPHQLAYKQMVVAQHRGAITIENLLTGQNGRDSTSVETLSYDGKYSKVVLPNTAHGTDTRFRTAAFANDGRSLTIIENHEINRAGGIGRFKITEVWTLSPDGNELTVKRTFVFTNSTLTVKAVYSKLL